MSEVGHIHDRFVVHEAFSCVRTEVVPNSLNVIFYRPLAFNAASRRR
jgi:hypothetical protein